MRPLRITLVLAWALLASACETAPETPVAPPELATPEPSTPPEAPPPVVTPTPIPTPTPTPMPVAGGESRVIGPIGPPMEGCIEMISVCRPDETGNPLCTSAPVEFQCGETRALPSGERLRCECEDDPGT